MRDPKAYNKLVDARINLLLDHYFWGHLAMRLVLKEEPSIPTLAVDGKHIFYNPDFVHTLSTDLTKSAFVHEIGHCMLEHFIRRNGREPKLWNVAGDYVINLMLKDSGFVVGKGWLLDEQYRDMSTEQIYDLLSQQQDNQSGQGQGQGQGQSGPEPFDQVMDGTQSAGDAAEQSLDWQVAVQQAAQIAAQHGSLPASMKRFLKSLEPPQVPWREVLQRFVTEVSKADYSWQRPSKKMLAHGYYVPSLYSQQMGTFVPVIDTSGSIGMSIAQMFDAEIRAAWAAAHPERMVSIECDAAVQFVREFECGEQPEPLEELHGGGGTDFRPPFQWLEDNDIKPACMIYLTDGYGTFPDQEPEFPVLWVMTTDVQPPWGEVVRLRA